MTNATTAAAKLGLMLDLAVWLKEQPGETVEIKAVLAWLNDERKRLAAQ